MYSTAAANTRIIEDDFKWVDICIETSFAHNHIVSSSTDILRISSRILSSFFIRSFKGQIINIHPSLLPKYKGLNTYSKIIKNKEIRSGCTVHLVNEKLDSGKILGRKFYYLDKNSNIENVKRKTQKLEHVIYSETIINLFKYKTNF